MSETAGRRIPEKSQERFYFPELDGLRFFAFLLVFIHHHPLFSTFPVLSIFHSFGWIGVDLFFALSAFLFTKLLMAEFHKTGTISFKKFYIRRIFRIWPVYFGLIAFSLALQIYFKGYVSRAIWLRLIGLFTFSDNIMTAFLDYNPMPYINHLWTITYEEQFYVFVPLMVLFLVRVRLKTKLISLVSIFILFNFIRWIMIAEKVPHPAIWVLPVTHFESILLGIAIGFGAFDFLLKKMSAHFLGILGLVFFVILSFFPQLNHISYLLILSYSLAGLSTSLILFSVSNSIWLKKILSAEFFVYLGKRSYGLYLFHIFGIGIISYCLKKFSFFPSNHFLSFILSLATTVLMSVISYRFLETPFLHWKKKFEVIVSRPI